MKAGIDWDQVVSLVAPRKIYFGWGALDAGSPEIMYRSFINAIEKRCRKESLDKCVYLHEEPKKGHEVTMAMLENGMRFFKANLK